ncbi:unnamed protein product [Alternaria burnsii]|nr:unnamed protein product [Alternaria burnsii]
MLLTVWVVWKNGGPLLYLQGMPVRLRLLLNFLFPIETTPYIVSLGHTFGTENLDQRQMWSRLEPDLFG